MPGRAAHAATLAEPSAPFTVSWLHQRVRELAAAPFEPIKVDLPAALTDMNFTQYHDIRFRGAEALWRDLNLTFEAQFFHLGYQYREPVHVFDVVDGVGREVVYAPALFDYGKSGIDPAGLAALGFSGFRLHYPLNRPDYRDEVAVFQGASYFRCLGRGEGFGLSARGLAVNTALPEGEEFPSFRSFWLERPLPGAAEIKLHALLDSPSIAGAYSFAIRPGETTVVDVSAFLMARNAIKLVGLAPLTSMYFFGENDRQGVDDYRPEVHDSDGMTIWHASGEWLWRPLINPTELAVTSFGGDAPRGFGLLQRDREFASYEDLYTHSGAAADAVGRAARRLGPRRDPPDRDSQRPGDPRQHRCLLGAGEAGGRRRHAGDLLSPALGRDGAVPAAGRHRAGDPHRTRQGRQCAPLRRRLRRRRAAAPAARCPSRGRGHDLERPDRRGDRAGEPADRRLARALRFRSGRRRSGRPAVLPAPAGQIPQRDLELSMDAVSVMRQDRQPAAAVLDLLRSLGVRDPNTLYALAARLPAASGDGVEEPARAARVILGEWFGRLLNRTDLDAEQAFLLGRAAFVAVDGGNRYPGALMTEEPPADFCEELRRNMPLASPAVAPAVMLVQSLDPAALLAPIAALVRGARAKGARPA